MIRRIAIRFGIMVIVAIVAPVSLAQKAIYPDTGQREQALKLFIDCDFCDMNYIRAEIPYVNYVHDVRQAQVYLRLTRERTGSGGRLTTLTFLGQENFTGMNDTMVIASSPDDTHESSRIERARMMKMGLMRYVAKTPLYSEVEITTVSGTVNQEVVDKWNNWVIKLESRPSLEGEESFKELSFRNSMSIFKVSHEWKIELDFDHRFTRTRYIYEDSVCIKTKSFQGINNLMVKSLGEHWAAGTRIDILSSTYNNVKLGIDLFPSLEYNLYPYSESTHRQFRFLYGLGNSFNIYQDTTIFSLTRENRVQQKLQIAYQIQKSWGSVNVSLEGSNYFFDLSKNRLELDGFIQVRIIQGLSLRIYGGVARINDQLSLVKAELSEADVLLQLQELATAYEFDASFGIIYTFGSIYNNIVNPRFGNGRRYFN